MARNDMSTADTPNRTLKRKQLLHFNTCGWSYGMFEQRTDEPGAGRPRRAFASVLSSPVVPDGVPWMMKSRLSLAKMFCLAFSPEVRS